MAAQFYPDLPWVRPRLYYTPLVGWCSLYLKKSFILLFLFSLKCSLWLQLNEDLEGHIDFLAQTGPFSVPIRCVTKKCQVFSYHNYHPLTTQLWYCCATSWGYSLVLHCASTTVKNIPTSKMAVIVTGCLERGIKGPFCSQNAYHSDFDNSSLLKRCSSGISPQSLHAKWSSEAEIVSVVSFAIEWERWPPFLLVFFTLMIMATRKRIYLREKNSNFLMGNPGKSPYWRDWKSCKRRGSPRSNC